LRLAGLPFQLTSRAAVQCCLSRPPTRFLEGSMTGLIIFAIVVAIVVYAIFLYNSLVRNRQLVEEGWSGIDVQLKRRTDLIPNLLETVKGYMGHERETLEAVTSARAAATAGANAGPEERSRLEGALSGALGRLLAIAEAYPDLKANTNRKSTRL